MKKVSFELIWAEEKERERIAAELHDRVGQSLLLAKMKLDALEEKLPDESLQTHAVDAASLIETSIHGHPLAHLQDASAPSGHRRNRTVPGVALFVDQ